jgi:hypothetical protein
MLPEETELEFNGTPPPGEPSPVPQLIGSLHHPFLLLIIVIKQAENR